VREQNYEKQKTLERPPSFFPPFSIPSGLSDLRFLPDPALYLIAEHLGHEDLRALRLTCKALDRRGRELRWNGLMKRQYLLCKLRSDAYFEPRARNRLLERFFEDGAADFLAGEEEEEDEQEEEEGSRFACRVALLQAYGEAFAFQLTGVDRRHLLSMRPKDLRRQLHELRIYNSEVSEYEFCHFFPRRACHVLISPRALYRVHFVVLHRDRLYVGLSDLLVNVYSALLERGFEKLSSFFTSRSARSLSCSPNGRYVCLLTGKPLGHVEVFCVADPRRPERLMFRFLPSGLFLRAPFAFQPWIGPQTLLMLRVPFRELQAEEVTLLDEEETDSEDLVGNGDDDCDNDAAAAAEEETDFQQGASRPITFKRRPLLAPQALLADPVARLLLSRLESLDVAVPRASSNRDGRFTLMAVLRCLHRPAPNECLAHFAGFFHIQDGIVGERTVYSFPGQVLDVKSDGERLGAVLYVERAEDNVFFPGWECPRLQPLRFIKAEDAAVRDGNEAAEFSFGRLCVNPEACHCAREPLPPFEAQKWVPRENPRRDLGRWEPRYFFCIALLHVETGQVVRVLRLQGVPAWTERLQPSGDLFITRALIHHAWAFDSALVSAASACQSWTLVDHVWAGPDEFGGAHTLEHQPAASAAMSISPYYFALVTIPEGKLCVTLYRRHTPGRRAELLLLAHGGVYHHQNELTRWEKSEASPPTGPPDKPVYGFGPFASCPALHLDGCGLLNVRQKATHFPGPSFFPGHALTRVVEARLEDAASKALFSAIKRVDALFGPPFVRDASAAVASELNSLASAAAAAAAASGAATGSLGVRDEASVDASKQRTHVSDVAAAAAAAADESRSAHANVDAGSDDDDASTALGDWDDDDDDDDDDDKEEDPLEGTSSGSRLAPLPGKKRPAAAAAAGTPPHRRGDSVGPRMRRLAAGV
jgi:hypothetical protein